MLCVCASKVARLRRSDRAVCSREDIAERCICISLAFELCYMIMSRIDQWKGLLTQGRIGEGGHALSAWQTSARGGVYYALWAYAMLCVCASKVARLRRLDRAVCT